MTELLRDIILVMAGVLVLVALRWCRARGRPVRSAIWPYLLSGLFLLCFGRVLEMTNTETLMIPALLKVILQEAIGFCLGFSLLAVALVKWLPDLTGREPSQRERRQPSRAARTERSRGGEARVSAAGGVPHSSNEMLTSVLKSSLSGVMVLRAVRDETEDVQDFECKLMNAAAEQILGRSSTIMIGRNVLAEFPCIKKENLLGDLVSVIETGLPFRTERHFAHARDPRWYQFVAVKLGDGLAVTFGDISSRKQAEEQLRHAAQHDTLTGLPNRALFTERLAQAINRAKRFPDYKFAVLFLDFDRFKIVNDSLGHDAGDQLLIGISERLRNNLRSIDLPSRIEDGHLPARLGGDEFVILLDSITEIRDVVKIAERLQAELSQPYSIDGHEVISTASIGIVTSDIGYDSADDIIRDADTAMYRAKTSGKARHVVFDEQMHKEVVARLKLERELREAVERQELKIDFEPIVKLDTGELMALEALIRWPHPVRGVVPPGDFLGLAEELNLIVPLGEWVLAESCRRLREWRNRHPEHTDLSVNINLAAQQLRHPDFIPAVRRVLEETGLDPAHVCLEITEAMVMTDIAEASRVLDELAKVGVMLVMDDFGSGQSSLSCLHRFPLNMLKIDREFISSVKKRRDYGAIVNAMVELAHNLGLTVVAEGVETEDQLALLQALNCDYAQGHYFSQPVDVNAVDELLSRDKAFQRAA